MCRSSQGRKLAEPLPAAPGIPQSVGKTFLTKQSSGGGREGGKPVWARSQGWRGRGMWETGKESRKGSLLPGGKGEQQGAGGRDAPILPIPPGCCNSTGSEWFGAVQVFHDFTPSLQEGFPTFPGRIPNPSKRDFLSLQEGFPISPGKGFPPLQEGFPISPGRIPTPPREISHFFRKDSHPSRRDFTILQEGSPIPFRNNFPSPPLRISHLSGKDFPAGPYLS